MVSLITALTNEMVGNRVWGYFEFQFLRPIRMACGNIVYFNKLFHVMSLHILSELKHVLDNLRTTKCVFLTAKKNSLGALGSRISAYS